MTTALEPRHLPHAPASAADPAPVTRRPLVERASWAIVFLLGTVAGLFLAWLLR
jgi:hypothetical protein